jgi:hypothetical protein
MSETTDEFLKRTPPISIGEMKELFYIGEDGTLYNLHSRGRGGGSALVDGVAGWINNDGYRMVKVRGKTMQAHRVVFAMTHGYWPRPLDHINGIRNDNRPENLREVTYRENGQNRASHRAGRLVGATYNKSERKWISQVRVNGKYKHLGRHQTEKEAHLAYVDYLATVDGGA